MAAGSATYHVRAHGGHAASSGLNRGYATAKNPTQTMDPGASTSSMQQAMRVAHRTERAERPAEVKGGVGSGACSTPAGVAAGPLGRTSAPRIAENGGEVERAKAPSATRIAVAEETRGGGKEDRSMAGEAVGPQGGASAPHWETAKDRQAMETPKVPSSQRIADSEQGHRIVLPVAMPQHVGGVTGEPKAMPRHPTYHRQASPFSGVSPRLGRRGSSRNPHRSSSVGGSQHAVMQDVSPASGSKRKDPADADAQLPPRQRYSPAAAATPATAVEKVWETMSKQFADEMEKMRHRCEAELAASREAHESAMRQHQHDIDTANRVHETLRAEVRESAGEARAEHAQMTHMRHVAASAQQQYQQELVQTRATAEQHLQERLRIAKAESEQDAQLRHATQVRDLESKAQQRYDADVANLRSEVAAAGEATPRTGSICPECPRKQAQVAHLGAQLDLAVSARDVAEEARDQARGKAEALASRLKDAESSAEAVSAQLKESTQQAEQQRVQQ